MPACLAIRCGEPLEWRLFLDRIRVTQRTGLLGDGAMSHRPGAFAATVVAREGGP
jgi:hypothetical protein